MRIEQRKRKAALSPDECLRRIGATGFGRIGVSVNALPAIFPVTYAQAGGNIYFRSARDSQLAFAGDSAVIAFEVDHVDVPSHGGWSVLVVGKAELVVDADEKANLGHLPTTRCLRESDALIRIRPHFVSGGEIVA